MRHSQNMWVAQKSYFLNSCHFRACVIQSGVTCLMVAAEYGRVNIAKAMIRYGADVNARDTVSRCCRSLYLYFFRSWCRDVALKYNQTALIWAAAFGQSPEMVGLLVSLGADVNATNCVSLTIIRVLCCACYWFMLCVGAVGQYCSARRVRAPQHACGQRAHSRWMRHKHKESGRKHNVSFVLTANLNLKLYSLLILF